MEVSKKTIFSEQLFISDCNPIEVSTILGSCVAICLYDPVSKILGMNHYLLPFWNGDGLKSLKYGNISNEALVSKFLAKGIPAERVIAKIFGGASINIEGLDIGKNNILIAREILRNYKIKVIAEDVGGYLGRKIIMSNIDGAIYLKYAADRRKGNDRRVN
ncbi:MAG: chemotaxis protein CheD [Candidatus Delongbacteria bacterium]|nr:chemotaxis protein CheD [Candidatus Delongbacteria bacterium]MBN2833803.1 chemotaxis protein CheD [Candidatus Delongbacteria bacterium]